MKIRKDYQDHFVAGLLVGMTGVVASLLLGINAPVLSALIAGIIVGSFKEFVYDKWMGRGTFEWNDILFTSVGAILMGLIVKLFTLILNYA